MELETRYRRLNMPALSITYQDLIDQLPRSWRDMSPRSQELNDALAEIVAACRANDLPALPAVVITAANGRPGNGYYYVAHPGVQSDDEKREAWEAEAAR